ncbi:TetR/AcrR family transcriptional regulator [Cryptosporangium aurantiacum]|uniref:Transcriptional regulator, TetR family n=1 Tax=Cryptosporangium aurantiacum TaxID=134849 RepID=A0A1M7Q482_9ACTN|nr:TetR/AcrR family transcriptional regulator [Cryptosporangium aurantiacum]SHN25100.1 transcriptional regulator, TetR family [Cryptosporangium aurantiacum]
MSTVGTEKAVREGSPAKRTAILAAARELFLRHGVDRVSMDAVAARATVSKRTVYDYFGDKRRLFLAILSDASESMNASVRRALDDHLSDDAGITTVPQLEKALTGFAIDLGTTIVGSADYTAAFALVAQQRWQEPTAEDDVMTAAAEEAFTERLAHFVAVGLLDADDPRLATNHFNALTVLLAYHDQPDPAKADPARVRRTMVDGVRAFIRAYGAR